MRKILALTIILAAFVLTGCASTDTAKHADHDKPYGYKYAPLVNWHPLDEGRRIATETGKPLLVDFGVSRGCEGCEFLQNNVCSKPEIVAKINTDFVPVYISLAKRLAADERELGKKYDYKNECLMLFLDSEGNLYNDPKGKEMRFVDKIEPGVFMQYLDHVREQATK